MTVTIKNYHQDNGLSKLIHSDVKGKEHLFQVKGVMGAGLGVEPNGMHVAFASGTGMLVFVDLIAHMILRLLHVEEGIALASEASHIINLDTFRLVLFTSFANEREAICLQLIDALSRLCRKHNRQSLFQHEARISRPLDISSPVLDSK